MAGLFTLYIGTTLHIDIFNISKVYLMQPYDNLTHNTFAFNHASDIRIIEEITHDTFHIWFPNYVRITE